MIAHRILAIALFLGGAFLAHHGGSGVSFPDGLTKGDLIIIGMIWMVAAYLALLILENRRL